VSAELLRQAFDSTASVLANVGPEQMGMSTPCESWTVRELVNHIVGGTTYFAVTAETGEAPQDLADASTGGGFADRDYNAEFAAGAARAVAAFAVEGIGDKTLKLPFGDLPASIFVYIAATDTFTHGWDLARATGQSTDLAPELARQLHETVSSFLSDSFRGPDGQAPFGPKVHVPESAPAADRFAGFMGRRV
jgi:uncharacterized protein (TIGR03086 family)